LYGGTERVVYGLTEQLVRKGHDVTLFATGDSKTSAKLSYTFPRAAYRYGIPWNNFLYPVEHFAEVFKRADEFDIIHIHVGQPQDVVTLAFAALVKTPVVFTYHNSFPVEKEKDKNRVGEYDLVKRFKDSNFISISDAQRTIDVKFIATVHNGLDFKKYKMSRKPGKDLVWIGRFLPYKGPKEAILAAKKTGHNLILAGKVDYMNPESRDYFTWEIEPLIDGKQIKYIGEVNDMQKKELLKKAKAFLMPIKWNEPFGLTVIEAMAMGVPVIAFDAGPMREIILDEKTGFIVKNVQQMAAAIRKVEDLNRSLISQYTKSHFSDEAMAMKYLEAYEAVIRKQQMTTNQWTTYALEKTNA
jgi:glycosyltransferase involved in cell wall biosynthesis